MLLLRDIVDVHIEIWVSVEQVVVGREPTFHIHSGGSIHCPAKIQVRLRFHSCDYFCHCLSYLSAGLRLLRSLLRLLRRIIGVAAEAFAQDAGVCHHLVPVSLHLLDLFVYQ